MEDEVIIELFLVRNEIAIQNTALKYGIKLHQLAMRILYNTEDAEESVKDTYLTGWNTIMVFLKRYGSLPCRGFYCGNQFFENEGKCHSP